MKPIGIHVCIAMKTLRPPRLQQRFRAFTLLEMTIVVMVLLILMSVGLFSSNAIRTWRLGREASESLRSVYTAQKLYLSDNPTASVSTLTSTLLIPYLPNKASSMPTVTSLTGATLTIKVTVFPPVLTSAGVTYDPSGNTTDSLWDVGE